MDTLITLLMALNFMLGVALGVVSIARMDRRYAEAVRKERAYKAHFRRDQGDR